MKNLIGWYAVMETTKYKSVMEQTRNNSFHMNWPTGEVNHVLTVQQEICQQWFCQMS